MRIAQAHGFHTDMPLERFGEHLLERSRRIWWTIYVLDREMSSLSGLPQSISDGEICAQRPRVAMPAQRAAAIDMHIEICRSIASIGQGIYGANGRLSNKFLRSTKTILGKIAGLADKLQTEFSLVVDEAVNGLSRASGYLHLLYHQVTAAPSARSQLTGLTDGSILVCGTCDAALTTVLSEAAI